MSQGSINLFSVLNAYLRMPPGAQWLDLLTKKTVNALEMAGCYGFERTTAIPDPPLLRKKYIVPVGAGDDWANHDGEVATYDQFNKCWTFSEPVSGQLAAMPDGELLYYAETDKQWKAIGGGGSSITMDEVNQAISQAISQQSTSIENTYLKKSGGTMSGFITLHTAPTQNNHAATKQYVDQAVQSASPDMTYQHSATAVTRTISDRLKEAVTAGDYTDVKTRLKQSFNKPLAYHIPPGGVEFTVHGTGADFPTLADAFEAMRQWPIKTEAPITLRVQKGIHTGIRKGVRHSSPQEGLNITGTTKDVTVTGVTNFVEYTYKAAQKDNWNKDQEFKYYHVTFKLSSAAGLSAGEWLCIREGVAEYPMPSAYFEQANIRSSNQTLRNAAIAGRRTYRTAWNAWVNTMKAYIAYGAHEIVSVDTSANTVTVISYNHVAPIKANFPSAVSATVVQSVMRYDPSGTLGDGVNAFILDSGGYIGNIDNVAIIGRSYPTQNGNRGPYEYQEPINFYGFLAYQNTKASFGKNAIVAGFCADNLLVSGKCDFFGFTSNSWGHNIVITQGGAMRLDDCVSHGGWLDGVCCQDGGDIAHSKLYCISNARNGVTFSQGCNTAACNFTTAVYNGTVITGATGTASQGTAAGVGIPGGAVALANNTVSAFNVGYGVSVTNAASATIRFARVFNNTAYGVRCLAGASLSADQSDFYGNATGTGYVGSSDFDIFCSTGSTVSLGNNINAATPTRVRSNPLLNCIGRRSGWVSGDDDMTHDGGVPDTYLSIATSTATNQARDATFWHNGKILAGGKESPGTYNGLTVATAIESDGGIAAGDVFPTTDNVRHLGLGNFKWKDIWCGDSTIHTSDWRMKDEITPSPLGLSFLKRITPIRFKWLDYTETSRKYTAKLVQKEDGEWVERYTHTGDEVIEHKYTRPHYGVIAQQVKAAYLAEGEKDFAGYVEDGDNVAMRYEELIPILIRGVQELSARVEELEAKANVKPKAWTPPEIQDFGLSKRTEVIRPIEEREEKVDV